MKRLGFYLAKLVSYLNIAAGLGALVLVTLAATEPFYDASISDALLNISAAELENLGALRLFVWSGDFESLMLHATVPLLATMAACFIAARVWSTLANGPQAAILKLLAINFVLSLIVPLYAEFSGLNALAIELLKAAPGSTLALDFVALISPDPRWNLTNLLRPHLFGNGALLVGAACYLSLRWQVRRGSRTALTAG